MIALISFMSILESMETLPHSQAKGQSGSFLVSPSGIAFPGNGQGQSVHCCEAFQKHAMVDGITRHGEVQEIQQGRHSSYTKQKTTTDHHPQPQAGSFASSLKGSLGQLPQ